MASDKFLDIAGLTHFWNKIKSLIPSLSKKTQSIPFGEVGSSSTSTVFVATVEGIDELRDGVCCYIRNDVVTSAENFTLNVNNLGAKPVYSNTEDAGRISTSWTDAKTFLFVYNSTRVSGGCWDAYYGNASIDESNLVHKTGIEIITGKKTFSADVTLKDSELDFQSENNLKKPVFVSLENAYTQEGYSIGVLKLRTQESQNYPVVLRGVYPMEGTDAASKSYVDYSIENIQGVRLRFCSWTDEYGLHPYSLVSTAKHENGFVVTPFTVQGGLGTKTVITGRWFPIGSKIYYYDNAESGGYAGADWVFYSCHKRVDARYTALSGSNVSLGSSSNLTIYYYTTAVFLRVMIQDHCWAPYYKQGQTNEIIVSFDQLVSGNYYIYIGRTASSESSEMHYIIELEDNNPLYYYDGESLIPFSDYEIIQSGTIIQQDLSGKADKVGNATAGNFAGLDATGNLTDSGKSPANFATAAQGLLAETAIQSMTVGTTTTGEPNTNASVTNSGTQTAPVLDFTIPRGADGYNPFKGWFTSDTQLTTLYPNPNDGDYAYVQVGNDVVIYQAMSGYWRGTSHTFNPSNNQEFASGEYLNLVSIINNLTSGGATNVLSAQQGVVLNNLITQLNSALTDAVATIPILSKKTAQEIQNLIDSHTWVQGVLYYSVED